MELRLYYQKIREVIQSIPGEFTVVVSIDTGDGGKAGVAEEVSRAVAGRLVVDGRARLATEEEAAAFAQKNEEERITLARENAAHRLQVALVSEESIAALSRERMKGKKTE
jgi:hypothetical protein